MRVANKTVCYLSLVVSLATSTAGAQYYMGALPVDPKVYESYQTLNDEPALVGDRPGAVDLSSLMPPVGDQGQQNSCAAWAICYAAGSYTRARMIGERPRWRESQLSPAYVYNQTNAGRDGGSYLNEALELFCSQGCATLDAMPYSDDDWSKVPSVEAMRKGREFRIEGFARLKSGAQIKQALSIGYPVVVGVQTSVVFNDPKHRWRVYSQSHFDEGKRHPGPKAHGLHAMCIVGYDDAKQAFKLMNSWGNRWREDGYCWVHYDLFKTIQPKRGTFCREAWILEVHARRTFKTAWKKIKQKHQQIDLRANHWAMGEPDEPYWYWMASIVDGKESENRIAHVNWTFTGSEKKVLTTPPGPDDGNIFKGATDFPGFGKVTADVHFRDGQRIRLTSGFIFVVPYKQPLSIEVKDTYWGRTADSKGIDSPTWEWRAFIDAASDTMDRIERVEWDVDCALEWEDKITRDRKRKFDIWGLAKRTHPIAATVRLRDGTSHKLRTVLAFESLVEDEMRLFPSWHVREVNGDEFLTVTLGVGGPTKDLVEVKNVSYRLPRAFTGDRVVEESADRSLIQIEIETDTRLRQVIGDHEVEVTVQFNDGRIEEIREMTFFDED